MLGLLNENGKTRAVLSALEDRPLLSLFDAEKTRAVLGVTANGKAGLILLDAAGKPIWSAP